jgi:hypothetical protein
MSTVRQATSSGSEHGPTLSTLTSTFSWPSYTKYSTYYTCDYDDNDDNGLLEKVVFIKVRNG